MTEARKIAAILVADIVGYSRLAGADEDRTLARLRALRSDLIDPTIAAHRGRIVKRTGDGSIIEFRSVVDAVRCAIEVQNGLIERNAGLPAERRIEFRVGVHLGDVVEEADGDLMGDGVNIAARLESICEPGDVCLSEDAYRQVRDKLKWEFIDLGEKDLKNIARPVRAYALTPAAVGAAQVTNPAATVAARKGGVSVVQTVLAAALALALLAMGWLGWRTLSLPREPAVSAAAVNDKLATAPRLSIVVLPFENLSADKEQDYFADGITDDLTPISRICPTASSSPATPPSPTKARRSMRSRSGASSACATCSKAACAASAKRSPSTRSSFRPRPARMSGPIGSTENAASSANYRWSSSPVSPIHSAWNSCGPRLCVPSVSGRTTPMRSIFPCVDGRNGIAPPPSQAKTPPLLYSSARWRSTPNLPQVRYVREHDGVQLRGVAVV